MTLCFRNVFASSLSWWQQPVKAPGPGTGTQAATSHACPHADTGNQALRLRRSLDGDGGDDTADNDDRADNDDEAASDDNDDGRARGSSHGVLLPEPASYDRDDVLQTARRRDSLELLKVLRCVDPRLRPSNAIGVDCHRGLDGVLGGGRRGGGGAGEE